MWRVPKNYSIFFGGPYNKVKDYSILGSTLGYPGLGKLPCGCCSKF